LFTFIDRLGNQEVLTAFSGEQVEDILLRNHIPPSSVLVLKDGSPVADTHEINLEVDYLATLIEGYDLSSIRNIYKNNREKYSDESDAVYVKRRLSLTKSGAFDEESAALSLEEIASYVEATVLDTCVEFEMFNEGDGVLLGLSGGVDSSSLLLALSAARKKLSTFRLVAVTFEDFDSSNSPTLQHAIALANQLNVEHHLAPAGLAEEIFNLNTPLRDILPRLMNTEAAHQVMYIDHHTTRRVLEVFAAQKGLSKIALGLHTTDLIAGLLNGWMTGYNVANLPVRQIEDITYTYPLAFISKRELHLYHLHSTGHLARHTNPNQWEKNPKDRNFYYFLADQFQYYWPSIETMLFTAHNWRLNRTDPLRFERCQNCGSALLQQPFTVVGREECDVCMILRRAGYIKK